MHATSRLFAIAGIAAIAFAPSVFAPTSVAAQDCNSIDIGNVSGGDVVIDGGNCEESTNVYVDNSVEETYVGAVESSWVYDPYYHDCNVYDQYGNYMYTYEGYC